MIPRRWYQLSKTLLWIASPGDDLTRYTIPTEGLCQNISSSRNALCRTYPGWEKITEELICDSILYRDGKFALRNGIQKIRWPRRKGMWFTPGAKRSIYAGRRNRLIWTGTMRCSGEVIQVWGVVNKTGSVRRTRELPTEEHKNQVNEICRK